MYLILTGSLYVIRKKLEPLETYVPAVLLTQLQIKDIELYDVAFDLCLLTFKIMSSSAPDKFSRTQTLDALGYIDYLSYEESLEVDQPQYASYRSFLRSGPAASFRSNVRAVAEYASDGGNVKTAFDDVERCLRALDELDSLLLRASRNSSDASAKLMKEKISTAMNALNSLLETVPTDVLDKAKAIAEAYRSPESSEVPEELDQELKELQSIL
ncbi:Phosphoribosylformylglycinamidine synthase subunit PurQ [Bienertia sinuspersici]